MQKKQLLVVGSFALILICTIFIMSAIIGATIPQEDMTRTRQMVLEVRIGDFFEQKGVLPSSLLDLPKVEGKDNSTKDGWGREMLYLTNGNVVLLRSYGCDGKVGGVGKDTDLEIKFTLQ